MGAAALALFAAAGGGMLLAQYVRPVLPETPERTRRAGAGRIAAPSDAESGIVLAPETPPDPFADAAVPREPRQPVPPSRGAPEARDDPEREPPVDLPDPEAEEAARDASGAFEDAEAPPQ